MNCSIIFKNNSHVIQVSENLCISSSRPILDDLASLLDYQSVFKIRTPNKLQVDKIFLFWKWNMKYWNNQILINQYKFSNNSFETMKIWNDFAIFDTSLQKKTCSWFGEFLSCHSNHSVDSAKIKLTNLHKLL